MPVLIIVSSVRVFSSHDSLRPTRRPRLTSLRYVRMAIRFVARRSLDLAGSYFSEGSALPRVALLLYHDQRGRKERTYWAHRKRRLVYSSRRESLTALSLPN